MSTFNTVVDSGKREEMTTGSVRDSRDGKGRFDLLSTHALRRDARHMENGAKKYGDRNWEKGQPVSRFYDSAMRHMVSFLEGKTDEDHLSAARWNIAGIIHMMEEVNAGRLPKELIDLPNWKPKALKIRLFDYKERDGDPFGTGGLWVVRPGDPKVYITGRSSTPQDTTHVCRSLTLADLENTQTYEERHVEP